MRIEAISKKRENVGQKGICDDKFLRQLLLLYQFVFSFPNGFVPDLLFTT